MGSLAPDAPIISFSSLSKAYLAPGWRTGWMVVGHSPRLDDLLAAIKKLADGRLCSNGPTQYAIKPALLGDRSHQESFRAALRARANLTMRALNAIPGMSCVAPSGTFYAMPKVTLPPGDTDERLHPGPAAATGVLCVYGSGLRHAGGGRVLPGRVSRQSVRPGGHLRQHRRVHPELPARVTRSERSPLRIVAWSIVMVGVALVVAVALYQVRTVLMLVYVSALLAIGLAPIVRAVERQKVLPVGTRTFPRWLAILTLYVALLVTVIGIGLAVVPPLIEQGQALVEQLPDLFARGQQFLDARGCWITSSR